MALLRWALLSFLSCVVIGSPLEEAATPELTPEFLDQLLGEERYDEFEKYMNLPKGLSRPNQGNVSHPMHNENLFEGDIALTSDQLEQGRQGFRFDKYPSMRWPGRPAIVPYVISNQFSQNERRTIWNGIAHWNRRVQCVKFCRHRGQSHYVNFFKGNGCYAVLGRAGRQPQPLSLGNGCVYRNIILHEMMHAIGISHEQNRHDRDDYIQILWGNIPENWRSQYNKNDDNYRLLSHYDYYSIMHYGVMAPGTNRRAYNIRRGGIDERRIGNGQDFTGTDLEKIRILYC